MEEKDQKVNFVLNIAVNVSFLILKLSTPLLLNILIHMRILEDSEDDDYVAVNPVIWFC